MPRFANPDEQAPDYSLLQLLRDVWSFARPYRGRLFLISVLVASREASSLYGVYAFASIVTLLSNNASAHITEINHVIALLIATIAWQFISVYFSRIYGSYIIEKIGFDLELQGIGHLFKVDIAWHEKENAGSKLKRVNNGTSGVQQIIRLWLNSIIQIVVTILGAIYIVAKFNFFTATVIVIFIAVHYSMSYYLTKKAARSSYAASLQSETVSGLEVQAVSNIRTVKVMALTEPLHTKILHEITDLYQKVRRRIFLFQTRASILALWGQSVRLGTLIYIVFGVVRGQYELGFLILFNGYFNIIRDLAGSLSDLTQDITIARFSVSRLESLLKTPTPIDDSLGKENFPSDWKNMHIQNIAFGYGDNQVLHDVSFTVNRGEKIGIVGLSGAGKSTLFKLLLKEHENFSGSILFDQVPIQKIKAAEYFKYVAVVLQETEVFNFSVEENITIADIAKSGDAETLENALTVSHVQDFLPKLPQGLATVIGEKGVKLSGGEKQRLGIARAVYKRPQILLLDEATSHLDLESEEKIQDSLHQFFENVTAIVIAHRLTTIKEMDKILVIEEGKILEQGNFDELYKKKGRFFELWEKQKL